MTTGYDASGGVIAHIRSVLSSLLPTERAVAEVLLRRPEEVIEMSSQQVADAAGASRATVVRTCQTLGFTGYQQFRVILARDLGPVSPTPNGPQSDGPRTVATAVRAHFSGAAESLPAMTALLDDADLVRAVDLIAESRRVLVVGNGLSAPLAQLAAQRFTALGRYSDAPTDGIAQQVAARQLGPDDALLVISGSGANDTTMRCVLVAQESRARIILITAFGRSPITAAADVTLVVGMRDPTFRDELTVTTRIPQFILAEALVAGLSHRLGRAADDAHAATMAVVAKNLTD